MGVPSSHSSELGTHIGLPNWAGIDVIPVHIRVYQLYLVLIECFCFSGLLVSNKNNLASYLCDNPVRVPSASCG